MDGDEMTRILWKMIKDIPDSSYIDLKSEYYDLGMKHRDDTDDEVTIESALCQKNTSRCQMRHHYGKCGPCKGI